MKTRTARQIAKAEHRAEQRAKALKMERAMMERHERELAPLLARLERRGIAWKRGDDRRYHAERILADRQTSDRLASRKPGAFAESWMRWWSKRSDTADSRTGWRASLPGHLAYLFGDCGYGLPLAAEGGKPFRCADRVTSELSHANYLMTAVWRVATITLAHR